MTTLAYSRALPTLLILLLLAIVASTPLHAVASADSGDAYLTLADILEDDAARERLIRELRELSAPAAAE